MYIVYANNTVLHNPRLAEAGRVVVDPVLHEALNKHGSLTFSITKSNPLYDSMIPRRTMIRVVSDVDNGAPDWWGRVISVQRTTNNAKRVFCEGELAFLLDSIYQPFGFKGSPADLLASFIRAYNNTGTLGPTFAVGNVSVTDPNNLIVRSSKFAQSVWEMMDDKLFGSSLGGFVLPRYDRDSDTHYIDYLTADVNDPYARVSSQTVRFGKNLLDFVQHTTAEDVVTALLPYGAELPDDNTNYEDGPPENGGWNGNRVTVASVNNGSKFVRSTLGQELFGVVGGTKTWDDVTLPSNLLSKAQKWVDTQAALALSLEVSAVDLSFVKADIEQIRLGDFVRVISEPHDLDAMLLCVQKETHLSELEESIITLGHPQAAISDPETKPATLPSLPVAGTPLQNTKIIMLRADETDRLTGSGCQSAFVTEAGKLFIIRTNSTYTVYDLNITSGSRVVNGTLSAGVPLNHNIGHGNSSCYNNGLAYISHWTADDGSGGQTTDGGLIHVFSVSGNTMTYLRDIHLPVQAGRRTEHYVYPGEAEILSVGWNYRSSANSTHMVMALWKKGGDGTYIKSWERSISGVSVAQGLSVDRNKAFIVDNSYADGVYTHNGIMVVDLATGLQKLDKSQTGAIRSVETEQLIPLGGGQFLIVGNRGGLFYCAETY